MGLFSHDEASSVDQISLICMAQNFRFEVTANNIIIVMRTHNVQACPQEQRHPHRRVEREQLRLCKGNTLTVEALALY